jgi:hypothetical protein
MAIRTKAQFIALYGQPTGTVFPDNTTQDISEGDMRDFGQDIADSLFAAAGTISGLTTNRIPYATSATTLGDDSNLSWDSTNAALTVSNLRIHTKAGTTNVFIGNTAGNFTLTATQSVGVGQNVLNALTNGSFNTFIGQNSGILITTGAANSGIGRACLSLLTTGNSNVAIGDVAGASLTTGSNNTFLGTNTTGITTGSNNIIVGASVSAQSTTTNNQLTIQNIIFGLGNSGTGTTVSTGFIGIGEPAPTRKFEVAGSLAIKAGTSTGQLARVGGVIHTNTTQTGNVGTGEDTLFTYTIPADVLATNKDTITAIIGGTVANTVDTKTIRVKFGATTIHTVTEPGSNSGSWSFMVTIIRTGATTQKCIVSSSGSTGSSLNTASYNTAAETLSGTVVLLVTGEATSNNDIVGEMFKVRWEPAE